VLVRECEDFDETQALKGITFEAFKTFNKILIRKLKMEICWKILRHYGYDDNLQLETALVEDNTVPLSLLTSSRSIELTQSCVQFLVQMFKAQASPKSNKLDCQALDRVFYPTESGVCPWDAQRETVYEQAEEEKKQGGGVTLESWVGLWIKHFNHDLMAAFKDLVLIGYCGQLKDAIHLVRFKLKDIHGVAKSRKSFNCLVLSPSVELVNFYFDSLIHCDSKPDSDNTKPRSVVRMIKEKHPSDKDKFMLKYLIFSEVEAAVIESGDFFRDDETAHTCDLIIYLF
jgi:hypothetical protein